MFLCYIDESGTSSIPGNSSHFVLAGLAIPIAKWRECDQEIESIKKKYLLSGEEIHIAWMLRSYLEQNKIQGFDSLSYNDRRLQVQSYRTAELLRLQRVKNPKLLKQVKKNYKKTNAYIHLSYTERADLIKEITCHISQWKFARLFAECIDKVYFGSSKTSKSIDEQTFEQIVSRFEQYLRIITKSATNSGKPRHHYGIIVHDNNPTIAQKHTELMREYHRQGTFWTPVTCLIETPLFVDSQLTSMIQMADICSYALRRYLENQESSLFDLIFKRADRKDGITVGVRHYAISTCSCKICLSHKRASR